MVIFVKEHKPMTMGQVIKQNKKIRAVEGEVGGMGVNKERRITTDTKQEPGSHSELITTGAGETHCIDPAYQYRTYISLFLIGCVFRIVCHFYGNLRIVQSRFLFLFLFSNTDQIRQYTMESA